MTGLFTLGETLGLITPTRIGKLRHQRSLDLSIGGSESNTAIAVARLGGDSTWLGRVSADGLGELVLGTIRAEGVRVIPVPDPGPMSLMLKDTSSALRTNIHYWRSNGPGSRLTPEDIPEEHLRASQVLHITGITPALSESARATVFTAIDIAAEAGVTISIDVNYRSTLWHKDQAEPVLQDLSRRANILFVGDDELTLLGVGTENNHTAATHLSALGPQEVIIKRGANGAMVLHDGQLTEHAGLTVPVIDTVGAGDAFAGGYLAEVLRGVPTAERLATGVACGAWAVTANGDWEATPLRTDIEDIRKGPQVVR